MSATRLKPVDAVVVGTGVVGSIMAKELTDAGLRVVAFERGRAIDPQHDFQPGKELPMDANQSLDAAPEAPAPVAPAPAAGGPAKKPGATPAPVATPVRKK